MPPIYICESNHFDFLSPEEFIKYDINCPSNKTKVLLTFDDGFYSNRVLAENVLGKYNIKAFFFITEKFLNLNSVESFKFSQINFYPNSILKFSAVDDYKSMSLLDIRWLLDNGHMIGAHSATHQTLSSISSPSQLYDEIVASADRLEQMFGVKINTFAFPYGVPSLISKESFNLADSRFQYIFSNVRGSAKDSPGLNFIFRQNIIPGDSWWLTKLIIEGRLDWKYNKMKKISIKKFY